jgi:hypothetical protein
MKLSEHELKRLEARARQLGLPIEDANIWGERWPLVLLYRIDNAIFMRESQARAQRSIDA